MSADTVQDNFYTHGALGKILAKTALPIIFIMAMNGLLTVVDAMFLGAYVGADALGAVTLMFPATMIVVALSTLVSNGMSSLLARHLGGNRIDDARAVFAGAHGLAILFSVVLITLFLLFGRHITFLAANGVAELADMGHTYLLVTILFSPALFVLSVNSDALRNEGRIGFMAAMSLLVSIANICFNYILIAEMGWGVAGSAIGTVLAQILAVSIIMGFRLRGATKLRISTLVRYRPTTAWRDILALGAPQSLNFLGISLSSAATIAALQMVQSAHYETTVAAFGIMTRVMTFVFLPHLGLCFALQSMIGNNYGASLWGRSDNSLRLGLITSLVYCLSAQLLMNLNAEAIGYLFIDDTAVVSEVQRILPIMTALLFVAGIMMIIATYFQAIGDAARAALLSLIKPYLFGIPLIFILAHGIGEPGIWYAGPTSEALLVVLAILVLSNSAKRKQLKWGLFMASHPQPASTVQDPAA
ncbi:MAG: MATE family efflux transporter [Roseibium sp.]